jgi:predicted Zn-dependent protease with MMP-like domain
VADKKDRFALISRYKKLTKEKNLKEENINIHIQQWAADSLIESYGIEQSYDLVEYYIGVSASPTWKWFVNNADKIYDAKRIKEEDDVARRLLREQAKEWLNR